MATSGCSLNWGGFDKALAKASSKMKAHAPLMASIGEALVSGTIHRFEKEVSPEGKAWPQSRRAAAEGGKTLTDTGRLRNSVDYAALEDKVMVGSNAKYARIHQMGGDIKPKKSKKLIFTGQDGKTVALDGVKMPARPFIGISDEDMAEVKATIQSYLSGAFKG